MSPKQQFLETHKQDVNWLADIVASERFQMVLNYAMLEFLENLPKSDGSYHYVLGAKQFRQTLETLWKQSEPLRSRPTENLDHRL